MRKFLLLVVCWIFSSQGVAQTSFSDSFFDFPDDPKPKWLNLSGAFLEPNRFTLAYDLAPERLRLEAGYGTEFVHFNRTAIGAEILVWSGLKALSDFRFPVETADYFFGLYSVSAIKIAGLRYPLKIRSRLSHISSHRVDGTKDSIIGGASSQFSREFVTVEGLVNLFPNERYIFAAGVKYVFHQINKHEPTFQFPITLDFGITRARQPIAVRMFISTAAGPSLPCYSAGLVCRLAKHLPSAVEIYAEYHHGHSRYATDGERKQKGFEAGIRIGDFPFASDN